MKKNTLLFYFSIFCFAFTLNSNAQQFPIKKKQQTNLLTEENAKFLQENGVVRCYTVENEIALQNENPERSSKEQFENWLQPKVNQLKQDLATNKILPPIFNIPVVIHIIHNGDAIGTGENISNAQALSQISVLQDDFRRTGARGNTNSTGVAVDSEINFCAAQIDPNGNPTTGIVRHNIQPANMFGAAGDWDTRAAVQAMKATTQWDPTKYLNIWTVRFGGDTIANGGLADLLGFAQFPEASTLSGLPAGGDANTDGVVLTFDATGSKDYEAAAGETFLFGNSQYIYGRTGTHEVGHWLGLRHIWGDGDCTADDFCNDTPLAANYNTGCATGRDSCPTSAGLDMYQNYMDYSSDVCLDTYTQDQKTRMVTVMQNSPRRIELNTSNVCTASTIPTVGFTTTARQKSIEGTGCSYNDYTFNLNMNLTGSAATTATLAVEASTATEGVDFQLLNNSVTFNSSSTAPTNGSGDITLRIFNDAIVENDETIQFGISVNTTGNAIASTTKYNVTIVNDDFETVAINNIIALSDNGENITNFQRFSNVPMTNSKWTGLNGVTTPGVIEGNFYGCRSNVTGTDATDDFIIAPSYTFPDNITSITVSSAIFSIRASANGNAGNAQYQFFFSDDAAALTGVTNTINAPSYNFSNSTNDNDMTELVINDANFINNQIAGKTGNFSIRNVSVAGIDYYLVWDNITITVTTPTEIQTIVNTGSGEFKTTINQTGTIYPKDTATSKAIADIQTSSAFDYGCTTISVSRAGTGAQNQYGTANSDKVTDKTFTITSTNDTATSNTISFYFTEAELAGWEAATGENRSSIAIKRVGSTQEVAAATISAFGSNSKLSGTFTSGIQGTYYFGKANSLSVDSKEFNNFSLFPNPATNEVNIAFDTNNNVNLSLFDIRGRNVLSSNKINNSNRFETKLDVSNISSGIYLLNITSGDINVTKKIIIN